MVAEAVLLSGVRWEYLSGLSLAMVAEAVLLSGVRWEYEA
jgi:hypothetical protein